MIVSAGLLLGALWARPAAAQAPRLGVEVEFGELQIARLSGRELQTPSTSDVAQGAALAYTSRAAPSGDQRIGGIDLLKVTYDVGTMESNTLEMISGPVSAENGGATNVAGHEDVKKAIMLFVDAVERHAGTPWATYAATIDNASDYDNMGIVKVVSLKEAIAAFNQSLPTGGPLTRDLQRFSLTRDPQLGDNEIVFLVKGGDDDAEANPQGNFGMKLGQYGAGALLADHGRDGTFTKVVYAILTGGGPNGVANWLAAAPQLSASAADMNMRGLFVYIRMHFLLKAYSQVVKPHMRDTYVPHFDNKIRAHYHALGQPLPAAGDITVAARRLATNYIEGIWSWLPKNHWMYMPKASFDDLLTAIGDGAQVVTRYTAWQNAVSIAGPGNARQNALCDLPAGWENALSDVWERGQAAAIVARCREEVAAAGLNLRVTHPLAPHPVAPFQVGGQVAMLIEARVNPLEIRDGFQYWRRSPSFIYNFSDWVRAGEVGDAVRRVCTLNGFNRDTCQ